MARLVNLAFELAGSTYEVTLDFDDAALVQATIAFDVVAECTGGKLPRVRVDARVEIIPQKDTIIIYVAGKEVFRTNVFDHGPTPAEKFIQAMPAAFFGGHPILGCAIKAGVSSTVGQAIDCARSLEQNKRWEIVSEFLHCMSRNFGKISMITMYRTLKCIGGF
jgi:hypothetical protein